MAFDPDQYLEKKAQEEFDPDAYLASAGNFQNPPQIAVTGAQALAPAGMGGMSFEAGKYAFNPTGIGEVVGAAEPITNLAKNVVQGYKTNPVGAIADAVLLHGGMPPVFGSYKGAESLYNTYRGVKQTVSNLGDVFSRLPADTSAIAGRFLSGLSSYPGESDKLLNLINANGLEQGIKNYVPPESLVGKPLESFNSLKSSFPSTGQKIMAGLGPIARGAGRVIAPIGMAMDVYDAGKMARYTELGSRLQQGQGQRAQQAFRNMNPQYGGSISPEGAQNVMASGSARDIQYFGGMNHLQQLSGPELKRRSQEVAASKILRPQAP